MVETTCSSEWSNAPEWISAVFVALTFIILTWAAKAGRKQLDAIQKQNITTQEQNSLNRIVAWKSSLQNVNDSILEHPDPFLEVLYPPPNSVDEMKKSIAAYNILNALETVYYMRKSIDEKQLEDIRKFLETYISHKGPIRDLWKEPTNRSAFTSEFQTEISNILYKINKSPSTSPPAADTRDSKSESRVPD